MIPSFDYKIPRTLEEAYNLLWEFHEEARIIAGGTDLLMSLRNGDLKPRCLIDITGLEELREIEERDGMISVGAGVTHSEVVSSPLVVRYGKLLSEAACRIGSPQIRNLGTLGGNIVNASPAADTIPPLMVLDAVGQVMSKEGEKEVPLCQLFNRPYETSLKPYEILTQVRFPKLLSSARSSFIRLARREAMAIARMSVAVILQLNKGVIEDIRISVGSVTPTPGRMSEAEAALTGKLPNDEGIQAAARKVSETMIRQSGMRPSTAYKKPVVEALVIRAIQEAIEE
ncbi:MAG TPA: xanthine dehydrogenase family protein subunit M [Thermodesulfobacteriota bacterium]|nr:xanthine dehydrogenase family protein subunit M [Thermodesulfobacteriota bacterium]